MIKTPVYMDYHATTPLDPRVLEAMIPFFIEKFGNPASRQHAFGWVAEEAVESSRASIARHLGCEPRGVIFTSGATESNNLALKGAAEAWKHKGNHIVTVQTEHASVLDTCKKLEKQGYEITFLPVDEYGIVDLNRLKDALKPATILVSVMFANNEIGTVQSIAEIGKLCCELGILFHTDGTQAVGKIPVDVQRMSIDLMSFTAHKMCGPKGVGVLYVRQTAPRAKIAIQMEGGGHERGMRSGTLNVPGIVGLGKALDLSIQVMAEESKRLGTFRDKIFGEFSSRLGDVYLNGHPTNRLPNNLNVSFLYVDGNALMMSMKDIAVSSGSACSTADPEPSHVLKALRLPQDRLHSAIRFGFGRFTTEDEVKYVIGRVVESVQRLRETSPVYLSHLRKQKQILTS